jgi:hypothetical protein
MSRTHDPLARLSRPERHAWRVAARRARYDHEAEQLATLRVYAESETPITAIVGDAEPSSGPAALIGAGPFEVFIGGRRLRGRICRPALAAMKDAISTLASVRLLNVGRYGPYWVLTFRLAAEPFVVLADRLTLLPDWGGLGARAGHPLVPQFSV